MLWKAAGGGWYGGYVTDTWDCAGGGSGWIYTQSYFNTWKSNSSADANKYKLNSDYYLESANFYNGNSSFTAPGGGNETGHPENGYARITKVN